MNPAILVALWEKFQKAPSSHVLAAVFLAFYLGDKALVTTQEFFDSFTRSPQVIERIGLAETNIIAAVKASGNGAIGPILVNTGEAK